MIDRILLTLNKVKHYFFRCFVLFNIIFTFYFELKSNAFESSENFVQVCCPSGWWLVEITNSGTAIDVRYECSISRVITNKNQFEKRNISNVIGKSNPIHGYLLQSTSPMFLSTCTKPILNRYSHKKTTHLHISLETSCILNTGNELITITCLYNEFLNVENMKKLIFFVHKCCPIQTFYEREKQLCLLNNNSNNINLQPSNQHILIYRPDQFYCPQHKLLMEYYINSNTFASYQHMIETKPPKINLFIEGSYLTTKEYCLEPIVSSKLKNTSVFDVSQRSEMYKSDKFLVRICIDHGKHICQRIPCIRRCCNNNNEIVSKSNTSSNCKSGSGNEVSFQSFESLQLSATFFKPKGNIF